jgi:B-cell receptor-associated protein 31
MLLLTEMGIFMMLVLPIPFTWRKKLFQFISENPVVAKLQYGMKVSVQLSFTSFCTRNPEN